MDQAATAKQGNFYTFLNNTVVHQSGAGFGDAGVTAVLNFADDGTHRRGACGSKATFFTTSSGSRAM